MPLRIGSLNIERSAMVSPTYATQDRWPPQAQLIRQMRAAIVGLQETHKWGDQWRRNAARVERDTGMRLLWQTLNGGSTTLLYDPDQVELAGWEDKYARTTDPALDASGFAGVAVFDTGIGVELVVANVHLDPVDPARRQSQMRMIVRRVLRGIGLCENKAVGVVLGDFNADPLPHPFDPPPLPVSELSALTAMGSTILDSDGTRTWDRGPARVLEAARFSDAAHLRAQQDPDMTVLASTYPEGGTRLDQVWVCGLDEAVTGYRVVENAFSDHHGVLVTLDPALAT